MQGRKDEMSDSGEQRIIITSHTYVPGSKADDHGCSGDEFGCWHRDADENPDGRCGIYRKFHLTQGRLGHCTLDCDSLLSTQEKG